MTPKTRAALLSIVCGSILLVAKLVVGVVSGSVAVISEAIHSGTDLVASIIAFLSVRASDSPADQEHPYGHGKIESLSSLAEALLIGVAAIGIVYESCLRLISGAAPLEKLDTALAVMGLSAVSNFLVSSYLARVARQTDSVALKADSQHLYTDVVTSLGVFLGLGISWLTGATWVDSLVGLVVAAFILKTALALARESRHLLMDARLPADEETKILEILNAEPQVLGYHKLRTRKAGSQRHADVHVQIDDDCTLVEAHEFTERLEDALRAVLPGLYINIHIEPYRAEMRHQQEAHGLSEDQANPKRAAQKT